MELRIVYMGDSITHGQYIDPAFRWTTLVDDAVAPELRAKGITLSTHNKGVSGETTRLGLERFPRDVQIYRAHLVTLQFGLNDCNCWDTDEGLPRVSPEAYRANLTEMVERSRRFGAREIVLLNNHVTLRKRRMPSGEDYEAASARYSQIVCEVADRARTRLCDVRAAFEAFDETTLAAYLLPEPDVLHLSVIGNRVYAGLILPHIRSCIEVLLAALSADVEA